MGWVFGHRVRLLLALSVLAPVVHLVVLGDRRFPVTALGSIILVIAAGIYAAKEKFNLRGSTLTLLHALAWVSIFVGMYFRFEIPTYMSFPPAVGAAYSYGVLPLATLLVFFGAVFSLLGRRKIYAANVAIFAVSFLGMQIGGLMIFLPGAD